jgi:thiol-disulfide isomerase/thioredoxin
MKKMRLLQFIFLFLTFNSFSQSFKLPLIKNDSLQSFSTPILIFKNSKPKLAKDSVLILKNGLKIKEYTVFEKTIQNLTPNRNNTIRLLVGYYLNEMIMVADNNHNSDYTDDSVFVFKLINAKIPNKQLRNSLPSIKIDSIEIVSVNGAKSYYSTNIHFCPKPKLNQLNIGFNKKTKNDEISLMVFGDSSFYSPPFLHRNYLYHLEIIPHPFTFPVYPIDNSNSLFSNMALIKHITPDSLSMIGFQLAEYLINEKKSMHFEGESLSLKKIDLATKTIEFSIDRNASDSDSNLMHFNKYKHLLITKQVNKFISIEDKNYTLIEFGGSWCKPCRELMPELQKINTQVKDTISVISIFKEANFNTALNYYKEVAPRWDVYFESLQCNDVTCLAKLFNIGIYPTVLLLNRKGKELFRSSGSGCINDLKAFLKKDQLHTE